MTWQTCLLCDTAHMSAVWHSRHVCSVTQIACLQVTQQTCLLWHTTEQQTCLLCETADMSPIGHNTHVCCVTQQTCSLCDTADMSAVWHSRHCCCVKQQTCLLWHAADISAVRRKTVKTWPIDIFRYEKISSRCVRKATTGITGFVAAKRS